MPEPGSAQKFSIENRDLDSEMGVRVRVDEQSKKKRKMLNILLSNCKKSREKDLKNPFTTTSRPLNWLGWGISEPTWGKTAL